MLGRRRKGPEDGSGSGSLPVFTERGARERWMRRERERRERATHRLTVFTAWLAGAAIVASVGRVLLTLLA